ncbi:MAG: ABC transporter substrate-binding protein [Syntrophotaleaceae bacterium]
MHKSCKDRQFSFLAPLLPADLPTYGSDDAEIVIGYRPDLVMASFFSDENFLHQLHTAQIPMAQFGFFDDLDAIKDQVLLAGRLTGEEASAQRLVAVINEKLRDIQTVVGQRRGAGGKPLTVLYYDNMAYVAGSGTTFDSMCQALGLTNIAAAKGIRNSNRSTTKPCCNGTRMSSSCLRKAPSTSNFTARGSWPRPVQCGKITSVKCRPSTC